MCGLYAHAADPSDSVLSACDGSTELVLHPSQALTQADALAFCRQHHGASAVLPSSASLQAAQSLVQQGQVLCGVAAAPLPAAPALASNRQRPQGIKATHAPLPGSSSASVRS